MAGRPTLYSEELGQRICAKLAEGESLRAVCAGEDMPHESTVRSWAIDPNHPISTQFRTAREVAYLRMADEMLEIADDGTNDWMLREGKDGKGTGYDINGEHVQRSRLRVETRKWILSKMLPKVYGDKLTTEHTGKDGGAIETKGVSDTDAARRIAYMFSQAMRKRQGSDASE